MADVSFYYPPAYQRAPSGTSDSLSGLPASGGTGGTGAAGAAGPAGQDGASTLTGSQPPVDSLGKDGDTYIQLSPDGSAVMFWGAKENGHWPNSGTSLRGPPGAAAPPPLGGDGPPDESRVGPEGQLYLDRLNAALYQARA